MGSRHRAPGCVAIAMATLLAVGGCAKFQLGTGSVPHGGLVRMASGHCKPGAPLAGVYLPVRLKVVRDCVTVTGTVACIRHEGDGDVHLLLTVDAAYRRLLTPANAVQSCAGHPGPHLVVEIIPQQPRLPFVTNSATRGGFVTPAVPATGDHVRVTGPYVLDMNILHDLVHEGTNARNWAEIHPAWNVTITRATG